MNRIKPHFSFLGSPLSLDTDAVFLPHCDIYVTLLHVKGEN